MPRPPSAPDTTSASTRTEPYPPWDPLFPYNNLPPVPRERLTTRAIEERCKLATAALDTLRNTTDRLADPYALFQTAALVEAHASSAIEGIVTTIGEMIEQMDRPRLTNGADPDTIDTLRHYDSIIRRLAPPRTRIRRHPNGGQGVLDDERKADARAARTQDRDRRTARNHLHAADRGGSHPLDAGQALELHGRRRGRHAPDGTDGGRAPPVVDRNPDANIVEVDFEARVRRSRSRPD